MKEHERHNFYNLRVTKVSRYEAIIHHEQQVEKWRYAFDNAEGDKFVYTGKRMDFGEGQVVHIRGTVWTVKDAYGFMRLKRIRVIDEERQERLI